MATLDHRVPERFKSKANRSPRPEGWPKRPAPANPRAKHLYERRSDAEKLVEAQNYHRGMKRLMVERGYLNLAYSHLLAAADLAEFGMLETVER